MEFKEFPKIERFDRHPMIITQKIHGSNAAIYISENLEYIHCQSRTRIIIPENDNFGFATFVHANKTEFIEKLGPGLHFGEWAGLGINSGEGLDGKMFVLFDHWKHPPERPLPPQTTVVPVLYKGKCDFNIITSTMDDLKTNGSKLVSGYMRPEGIVISIGGKLFKKAFDAEETQWKKGDEKYAAMKAIKTNEGLEKYGHLLQPIRLEKLLSRDERYTTEYPKSISSICNDYIQDLVVEGQITEDSGEVKKSLGGELYKFIRQCVEKQ